VYPEHCTGCGVCIDVCDAGAVTVDRWAIPGAAHVALEKHQCRACGAPYHLPSSQALNDWLCPICARVNHYQNLFQVQP
jgi:ferredoxin